MYAVRRELTIVVKDGTDIEQVRASVAAVGLERCTSYAPLSIIIGEVAVRDGTPDPTIYNKLRAMPEIDSVTSAVIYHAI